MTSVDFNGMNDFYNLTSLDLSSNSILEIGRYSFSGLSKLQTLTLQNNNIRTIDDGVFDPIENLQSLDLSLNKLHVIPSTMKSLIHLVELDLSYNNISDLRNFDFIAFMPNLTSLKLQGNAINTIDNISLDVLYNSSNLVNIRLCGNPFRCNKALCDFMLYAKLYLSFSSYDLLDFTWGSVKCTYSCGYPFRYLGKTFDNVYGDLCLRSLDLPTEVPVVIKKNRKSVRVISIVLGVLSSGGVMFGFLAFIAFRRLRHLHRGFIFAGHGFVNFNNRRAPDIRFDALVYNHVRESNFVDDRLRPRLEDPPNDFHLCLPLTRDFRLGAKKLNNLRESMIASRCAIFVISEAFVQDARCKQALEVACEFLHRDDLGPAHLKQTGLILIILDPVLLDELPETLRVLVDRLVTLEWENFNEERCWRRLERALEQFREPDEI
ncbi:toll-like receptor 3 [Lytechinus variegatus]|uniref:toll-like receptor 3 n=1 Tax=Lytechinus variegatus TaxID=7654 RepID=UPI001BB1452F|nr:toll-like receptor 3 [Lytechinus variegatus]